MHDFKNQNGQKIEKWFGFQFLPIKPMIYITIELPVFTVFIGPVEGLVLIGAIQFLKPW